MTKCCVSKIMLLFNLNQNKHMELREKLKDPNYKSVVTDLLSQAIVGEIIGMKGQASFPSGLQLPAAEVHLEEGKQILIPLANLEVIA